MSTLRSIFGGGPVGAAFADRALLAAMARFEGALAKAEGAVGVIPPTSAAVIARVCADARFDVEQLARDARPAGALTIPFVKALTAQVAAVDEIASRFVHVGSTSQDVIDTAIVLQSREAWRALDDGLDRLGNALAATARSHRETPITGRTLLQAAIPVSFGWKVAGWLAALHRSRDALARAMQEASVVQFGGAGGTLASLGDQGMRVGEALARELDLALPDVSWHGARDRFARLGAELAIVAGVIAKIGRDVSLLMQPEVGEVFEPTGSGRGGSSAMPHKRNPVGAMTALEAGYRAPGLVATLMGELAPEQERGLGGWQTNVWTLADLFEAAWSGTAAMIEVAEGWRIDAGAMQANIDRIGGFLYAESLTTLLAERVGKPAAQKMVEAVCKAALDRRQPLREAVGAAADIRAHLDENDIDRAFDPRRQLGAAGAMIDRVLAAWEARVPSMNASPETT